MISKSARIRSRSADSRPKCFRVNDNREHLDKGQRVACAESDMVSDVVSDMVSTAHYTARGSIASFGQGSQRSVRSL